MSKWLPLDAPLGVVVSFGHVNMLTKTGVKERKLVVQSCSNLNQSDLNWDEALQSDHNMHLWLAEFSLDFYKNISCRKFSNPWNGQKWFCEVLSNILNMTMCWNSHIWKIYVHWVSLIFVKYFWNNKIIFPY